METSESQETNKKEYVAVANALAHPRAVVIMHFDTDTTLLAVETPGRSHVFASSTPR